MSSSGVSSAPRPAAAARRPAGSPEGSSPTRRPTPSPSISPGPTRTSWSTWPSRRRSWSPPDTRQGRRDQPRPGHRPLHGPGVRPQPEAHAGAQPSAPGMVPRRPARRLSRHDRWTSRAAARRTGEDTAVDAACAGTPASTATSLQPPDRRADHQVCRPTHLYPYRGSSSFTSTPADHPLMTSGPAGRSPTPVDRGAVKKLYPGRPRSAASCCGPTSPVTSPTAPTPWIRAPPDLDRPGPRDRRAPDQGIGTRG